MRLVHKLILRLQTGNETGTQCTKPPVGCVRCFQCAQPSMSCCKTGHPLHQCCFASLPTTRLVELQKHSKYFLSLNWKISQENIPSFCVVCTVGGSLPNSAAAVLELHHVTQERCFYVVPNCTDERKAWS